MMEPLNTRFSSRYAPIKHVELHEIVNNRVRGVAAPAGGKLPCAVVLASAAGTFGVAVAAGFSSKAKADGFRHGWCRFEVLGAQSALALGSVGELRCAATGRTVLTLDNKIVEKSAGHSRLGASVEDLLDSVRAQNSTKDFTTILPFAEAALSERGIEFFLDASFRYLLGRPVEKAGQMSLESQMRAGLTTQGVWQKVIGSEEFKTRQVRFLSGPYQAAFPFGLRAFEQGGIRN